jgi:hypothetical protein
MKKKLGLYFSLFYILFVSLFRVSIFAASEQISIDIKAGIAYKGTGYVPQIAVWTEDENGKFIETLYITESEGKGKYFGAIRRKEALPVWRNKHNHNKKKEKLDGVAGASSQKSFQVVKTINNYPEKFSLFLEVNKSFDYNNYFDKNLKSGEKGHNTGYSGQPSLVYQVSFGKRENINSKNPVKIMEVIGHGSPTGKDGEINENISKLTTALQIIDEISVVVR